VEWVARFLRSVFPRSRGPLRWTETLPLVLFLAVFAGVLFTLIARKVVAFNRPLMFGWMVLSVWVWWMSRNGWSGLPRTRATFALLTRLTLLGLFVCIMADPQSVKTSDRLTVVYALDVSASIGEEARKAASEFVARTIQERESTDDEVGLIVFGNNAAVEVPPDNAFPLEGGKIMFNTRVSKDATNIEQALSLASALIPKDARGRIVLVSDGSETAGNLDQVLKDEVMKNGIGVDVLPITYSYENEVWIERLELPQVVKLGEAYEATVVVSSLHDGKGILHLKENGEEVGEPVPVEIKAGKNRFDIPLRLRTPGYYEYTATIEIPDGKDSIAQNNEAVNFLHIQGEGKVLLVVEDPSDDKDWGPLQKALTEAERKVEVLDALDFPDDPLSLLPYDCVIFCNVAQDLFDAVKLQAMHDAVYNQGIGFLMVGGQNSFGPGGYHRTPIEDALPVSMDITKKKILPKGALVIILHTCEFAEGNTWAKRITKQAVKVLSNQDEAGVIDFEFGGGNSEGANWVVDLTPVSDYEKIAVAINGANPGDMPAFGPTMELGLKSLEKSDAASKHMIIISDGDPQLPTPALLKKFNTAMVTVSTVAIFPHSADQVTSLREIAGATGGRYYFPDDPNELPSIFIKEAKTLKRTMIQNKTISVAAGHPSPVLDGITQMPQLDGYVLTSLKENGLPENILFTVPEMADEGEQDPVLSIWRYGLGSSAAFTSDLSSNWGKRWITWDKYRAFVQQLMVRISRVQRQGHLRMWTYNSGNEGVVTVEDFHPDDANLDVAVQISGPDNQSRQLSLKQSGPRRYQATFPLWGKGRYQVTAVGTGKDREDRTFGGFIMTYSPEFLKFTSNWPILRKVMQDTGGQELTPTSKAEEIFNRRVPKRTEQPVFDWLLIALGCLVPLDVGIRRVQLDWKSIKKMFWSDKRGESEQTMGQLLARKQALGETLKGQKEKPLDLQKSTPIPSAPPPRSYAPSAKPPGSEQKKPPPPPEDGGSTTSRLLDMKRRRDQSGDGEKPS
jgi:uncharacterized membrane protein/Mg-chelatase subunit ChlD